MHQGCVCLHSFAAIGPTVPEISYSQIDRRVDRRTDRQTGCKTVSEWWSQLFIPPLCNRGTPYVANTSEEFPALRSLFNLL